jgi:hypothetical protein
MIVGFCTFILLIVGSKWIMLNDWGILLFGLKMREVAASVYF